MTMTSLVEGLQEITRVLVEHKVSHSYAPYRYFINLGEDVVEEQQKVMSGIEKLKEYNYTEYLKQQNTQKLMKARGKINILVKHFVQDIIGRKGREVGFINKIEKSEYKNIGWLLRKKGKKEKCINRGRD